jgi:hypothetical protein
MMQTPEKPKKKFIPLKTEGAVEMTCTTCQNHDPLATSLNDVPVICWDCISNQNALGFPLPFYTPKEE